ncbi:MAG TPA: dihydropteroate synthase [Gemmatimonadaceae bacterium]|nr:dihydropteroate synthase [Gemmatimonadaceae bacterium]
MDVGAQRMARGEGADPGPPRSHPRAARPAIASPTDDAPHAAQAAPATASTWMVRGRAVVLSRPFVMGVLNVTPDSFSDGGRFAAPAHAEEHAARMIEQGADIIDIGGESTRPQGARPVDAAEEMRRVLPVLRAIRAAHPHVLLSVDTVKSAVARAALDDGADIINDVSAFRLDPAVAAVCAESGAGVVLMHSRGGVSDMGTYTHAAYGADPVGEVIAELGERVEQAVRAGVTRAAIALDPGIGFAKRSEHSVAVLRELRRVVALGFPVVVGVSRKRFIGELSGVAEPAERVDGTTAANVLALAAGARIFRVHDAQAARRALDVAAALLAPPPPLPRGSDR